MLLAGLAASANAADQPNILFCLAADPAHRAKVTGLREKLLAQLKEQQDPRVLGQGAVFDNYPTFKKAAGAAAAPASDAGASTKQNKRNGKAAKSEKTP